MQGVFFRQSAKEMALELGVHGFACNKPDGSVYMEAEGAEAALEKFRAWCGQGPKAARVAQVEATEAQPKGYSGFEIRR